MTREAVGLSPLLCVVPPLPHRWIAAPVEDGVNDDFAFVRFVEDAVRKPTKQAAASMAMNFGVRERIATDSVKAGIQGALELVCKPFPMCFVPGVDFTNVGFGCRREVNLHRLFGREPRISFQERTSSGCSR